MGALVQLQGPVVRLLREELALAVTLQGTWELAYSRLQNLLQRGFTYIYIYVERERERERETSKSWNMDPGCCMLVFFVSLV